MPPDHRQPRPIQVETSPVPLESATDVAVVAVGFTREDGDQATYTTGAGADAALARLGVDAFELLERADAGGEGGEVVTHQVLADGERADVTVVLVGLGSGTLRDFRRAGAAVARAARGRNAATSIGALTYDEELAALVEGLVLGSFSFSRRSEPENADAERGSDGDGAASTASQVLLTDLVDGSRDDVVTAATVRALASWRSRTYALTPSNEKGPVQLERWASEAALRGGLELEVWDERRLREDGFGGILAVGSGSEYESRFLRMDYEPVGLDRHTPHVVLVGKGITFDSGGLSIKPAAAMMSMKRDMTGAGVVIAVMGALRELGVKVAVTGLVAAAENAVGAASMRPGDVVKHLGGRTSEIGNTDAEGRLVLADALAFAELHIHASTVVDVATLTGAGKVALGTSLGALFANDDRLAAQLESAGALAGEPLWRLPLFDEYEPLLDNTFADATNAAGGPGAITAALFLQHFVADVPWAHLDIASVGDSPTDAFEYTMGATGFGARLLLRWLEQLDPAAAVPANAPAD